MVTNVGKLTFFFFFVISIQLVQSAPQYYYPYPPYPQYPPPPPPNYPSYYPPPPPPPHYDHQRPQVQPLEAEDVGFKFEPHKMMSEAKEAATKTRAMADLIDTRGHDFLSLLGDYAPGEESSLNLRDISGYIRKAADFMESGVATAAQLSSDFSS